MTFAVWVLAAAAAVAWVIAGVVGSGIGPEALQARDFVPWLGLAGIVFAAALWAAGGRGPDRRARLAGRLGSAITLVGASALLVASGAAASDQGQPIPTPTASPDPSPTPVVSAAEASSDPDCGSIQERVDAAEPGSTVVVPACIYRETVTIDRPLTLRAEPGAEIRGSDVWDGWTRTDGGWVSTSPAPVVDDRGTCAAGTTRCRVAQQVFIDGSALHLHEGTQPPPGTFAVVDGAIVLGDDPSGHLVEVSVRELWVHVVADDVTIDGFTMRHSIAPAQSGGITAGGFGAAEVDGLTVRNSRLSDAHGAVISLQGGSGHRILDNRIERGGQLGLHLSGSTGSRDWLVQGNVISDNNTAQFDVGWEAGGLKSLGVEGLEIRDNEFAGGPNGDNGRGAWTDTDSRDVTFVGNRSHDNGYEGAFFESTHGLLVENNVMWNNGWLGSDWAWGGGIVLSSSDHAVVRDNVVAWNADGISVVSQARDDDEDHVDIVIEDNTIMGIDQPSDRTAYALAWVADGPVVLFDPASGNGGRNNRYWFPRPEGMNDRFAWDGTYRSLDAFAQTPGEEGPRYLSNAEASEIAQAFGLPDPPRVVGLDALWQVVQLGIGLVALGCLVGGLAAIGRRRGAALIAPALMACSAAGLLILGAAGAIWPVAFFGAAWLAMAILEFAREALLRRRSAASAPVVPD